MRRHHLLLHPATAISILALLVAAGAPAYAKKAVALIDGARIAPRTVGATQLKANAVTSAHVKNGSLTLADLAPALRTMLQRPTIAAGTVGAAQIAPGAVGSSHIADGAVATADLATGAVGSAQIGDGSITAADLASGTVVAPGGTLGAGTTLRGVIHPYSGCNIGGCSVGAGHGVSFGGYTMPTAPAAHVLESGAAPTATCPGSATSPQAASGALCIYLSSAAMAGSQLIVLDPGDTANGINYNVNADTRTAFGSGAVSPWGFEVTYSIPGGQSNIAQLHGTWAATA